jgi:putative CRISPR-associated protein (TIGR02620 family)
MNKDKAMKTHFTLLVTDRGAWVRNWVEEEGYIIDGMCTISDFKDMLEIGMINKSYKIIGDLPFSLSSELYWFGLGVDYYHLQLGIEERKGDKS